MSPFEIMAVIIVALFISVVTFTVAIALLSDFARRSWQLVKRMWTS
jgi:hypothetical protein